MTLPPAARYTWGGDEFLFVEIDEAMSLAANMRAMSIARGLAAHRDEGALDGLVDICPANASLLIRFDPDVLPPERATTRIRPGRTWTSPPASMACPARRNSSAATTNGRGS